MSHSLWTFDTAAPSLPSSQAPGAGPVAEIDVLIGGGGVAGMTAALLLQRSGKRVAVVEASRVGDGESARSTAHLTELLDARQHRLESKFGREGALLAAESTRAAIDRIDQFCTEFAFAREFSRVPAYLIARTQAQSDELQNELTALRRAGVDAAWTDRLPLQLESCGAVRVERQGLLQPLAYLVALAERLISAGGRIYEHTRILEVEDGEPCRVETSGGVFSAREVLVTTHTPVSSRVVLHTKLAAYRTYVVAARLEEPFPSGLFFDMEEPYHYLRGHSLVSGSYLLVGGEDHKTGHGDELSAFAQLQRWASDRFPALGFEHRWSGQILEPVDGLPFIGTNPGDKHVFVATGFSGNGITFGTLSGMLLSDLVLGQRSPWAELYRPSRVKPLAAARTFMRENKDFPMALAKDRVASGDVEALEQVPRGEGRLLRTKAGMVAVHRDEQGDVTLRSAVCTHLGCHVQWNNAEKTWDCPCHGSRFDAAGAVLNGPATRSLGTAALEEEAVDTSGGDIDVHLDRR